MEDQTDKIETKFFNMKIKENLFMPKTAAIREKLRKGNLTVNAPLLYKDLLKEINRYTRPETEERTVSLACNRNARKNY